MPTEAKRAAVAELKGELSAAKATIVADYRGLTVSNISAVRRALPGRGGGAARFPRGVRPWLGSLAPLGHRGSRAWRQSLVEWL